MPWTRNTGTELLDAMCADTWLMRVRADRYYSIVHSPSKGSILPFSRSPVLSFSHFVFMSCAIHCVLISPFHLLVLYCARIHLYPQSHVSAASLSGSSNEWYYMYCTGYRTVSMQRANHVGVWPNMPRTSTSVASILQTLPTGLSIAWFQGQVAWNDQ